MARSATRSARRPQPHAARREPGGAAPPARRRQLERIHVFWWAVASAVVLLIGSVAPWASAGGVSENATQGKELAAIGGAGFALLALLYYRSARGRVGPAAAVVAGAAALGVAVYDVIDIAGTKGVSTAWGLYLSLAAALGLIVAASAAVADPLPKAAPQAPRAEDLLFFSRLRRQARWMFAFLALVFAGTFVFLGVGSGSAGIGDLLQGNLDFLSQGGGSPSVAKARRKAEANPQDPQAQRAYAQALQADGQIEEAIPALRRYVALRPRNVEGLQDLAVALSERLTRLQTEAQTAQLQAQDVQPPAAVVLGSANPLGQELSQDKLSGALAAAATQRASEAYRKVQQAGGDLVSVYGRIASLQPADPSWQLQLILAAQNAGDIPTEIAASRRFLQLAPDDPSAPQVRARLKQLQQYQAAQQGRSSGGSGG